MENSAERGAVNSMLVSGAEPAGAVLASALSGSSGCPVRIHRYLALCDSEFKKISNCQLQFATINKP